MCVLYALVSQLIHGGHCAGLGMHPRHLPAARPLPPEPQPRTVYTVTANPSTTRVLCKGCRNPIPLHCMQIGYSDRRQMRWYHLGCLSGERWQEAAAPGRLHGLPHLPPSQQVQCILGLLLHATTAQWHPHTCLQLD